MARFILQFVLHHSATGDGSVDRFREEHKQRGFADIGYHYLIGNGHGTPDGHIGIGRAESKDGAGVYGNNKSKLHVCVVGNFHKGDPGYTGPPTKSQMSALGHLLMVWGKRYRRIDGTYPQIVGHCEITVKGHATACPGNQFPLKKVRLWFDANIDKYVKGQTFKPLEEFLGIQD